MRYLAPILLMLVLTSALASCSQSINARVITLVSDKDFSDGDGYSVEVTEKDWEENQEWRAYATFTALYHNNDPYGSIS